MGSFKLIVQVKKTHREAVVWKSQTRLYRNPENLGTKTRKRIPGHPLTTQ